MIDLEIKLYCVMGTWIAHSAKLNLGAEANTPRQALVNFANKLKRIKKEQVEAILK